MRIQRWGFWALIVLYAGLVAWLMPHRDWDPDEFEHLQAAWLTSEGLTPYRDFFEHHTPLLYLIAAPVFYIIQPRSIEEAVFLMVAFRSFSFVCSAGIAVLTWGMARRLGGYPAAAFALALLLTEVAFLRKGIEIRPDPLSTLCILSAAYALVRAFTSESATKQPSPCLPKAAYWMLLVGSAESWAILVSQKALFAGPGLALAFIGLAWHHRIGPRRFLILTLCAMIGTALAAAPVIAWFGARSALQEFMHYNFLLNAAWQRHDKDFAGLLSVRYNAVFLLLATAGLPLLAREIRRAHSKPVPLVLLACLFTITVGAVILPVVQQQYVFMALPFAAISGAFTCCFLLRTSRTRRVNDLIGTTLAVLLLVSAARNLELSFFRGDEATRTKLAFVLATVSPERTVMGSWSPGIAFRRPAWFYFFPHREIQAMISDTEYEALAQDLRTGAIHPELIDFDISMSEMPSKIVAEIENLYEPTGVAELYRRKPVR